MITVSIEIPISLLDFIKAFLKEKDCSKCTLEKECNPGLSYCSYILKQINSFSDEGEVDDAN